MAKVAPSAFDALLDRMYVRAGVDTLAGHLEQTFGITVARLSALDVGVFRVERADTGPPLVARLFSAGRSHAAAEADLVVLRHLADLDFRAERPFGAEPLTSHEGQSVLVTEFIKTVPKAKGPRYPIVQLGAMVARLHGLPVPAGADRPAGALHHFAEGTLADELRAAAGWLDAIEARVPGDGGARGLDALCVAVAGADGGAGLPEGLVHPDPVPKNVIFTADGPVLVDWTSAGRGPRLASMTLVLASGWAAAPFMKGYGRVVSLTDDERERLAGLLFSRMLINAVFRACRNPERVAATAKKLSGLRRQSEQKAGAILAI